MYSMRLPGIRRPMIFCRLGFFVIPAKPPGWAVVWRPVVMVRVCPCSFFLDLVYRERAVDTARPFVKFVNLTGRDCQVDTIWFQPTTGVNRL